jgi:hypothetical protein
MFSKLTDLFSNWLVSECILSRLEFDIKAIENLSRNHMMKVVYLGIISGNIFNFDNCKTIGR